MLLTLVLVGRLGGGARVRGGRGRARCWWRSRGWPGTNGDLPSGAVLAAVAMLAAHLAALVASYGPDALPVSANVVRLWLWRGLGVALVAPLVWLAALAVREVPGSGTVWLLGLAVALSVTVVAAAVTQVASPAEDS